MLAYITSVSICVSFMLTTANKNNKTESLRQSFCNFLSMISYGIIHAPDSLLINPFFYGKSNYEACQL